MVNNDINKINSDLFPLFENLKIFFNKYSEDVAGDLNRIFEKTKKATIIKSFEFNLHITSKKNDHIFFMIPTLRGICEEYITEKFLSNEFSADSNNLLYLLANYQRLKSSIAQWNYFKVNKSDQILYYQPSFPNELKVLEKDIKDIFQKKFSKIKLNPFPSVYFMASKTDSLELYNYLYHATSTFVHFHPGNLLRTGWGDLPNIQFSIKHFKGYYNYFTVFYSALLFCMICKWQFKNGNLKNCDSDCINSIELVLKNISPQPEIVTFDELNIGSLSRLLFYNSPA